MEEEYTTGFIEEYTTGLQRQDGDIHPILCGEICRRCFSSLAVNATPVHNEDTKLFTSTYDIFIQTTGIRDGVSNCVKILSVIYDNSLSLCETFVSFFV
jgi:hypothetical protein